MEEAVEIKLDFKEETTLSPVPCDDCEIIQEFAGESDTNDSAVEQAPQAKIAAIASSFWGKATDISKKVASGVQQGVYVVSDNVQQGMHTISEKAKNDSYARKMKKYNPLFPKQYRSKAFNRPNLIMIRDDAERRGIDVCKGAIGWLGNNTGMEVLYLYDEAVKSSGIQFIPSATCDAVYYVDSYDRNRYVRVDCIFSKALEEKIAELEHIAHALGAKSFSIEIEESNVESESKHSKQHFGASAKGNKANTKETTDSSSQQTTVTRRSGRKITHFEGSNNPQKPTLKWFAQDDNIKRLIEARCSGQNALKSTTLELEGAFSATMSQKTACAIDGAMSKMSLKASANLEQSAKKETHSRFIFSIEF